MHTFAVIIHSLFGTLFLLLALVFVPVWLVGSTVSWTVTNPQNIKTWIAGTGIYDNALSVTVTFLTQMTSGEGGEEGGASEESNFLSDLIADAQDSSTEYGKFAQQIFAPERLRNGVETIIDAFYAWFRGDTALPQFEVKVLDNREDMLRLLTLAFKAKFNTLPVCPLSSVASTTYNFNPLEATCRPIFITDTVVDQFISQLSTQPEIQTILDKSTFNSNSLNISPEATPKIQLGYTGLRWLSLLLGGVVMMFSGLFLLVFPWSKRVLLLGGFFIALGGAGIVGWTVGRAQTPVLFELAMRRIPPNYAAITREMVHSFIQQVVDTLARTFLWHTVLVAAVGVTMIGVWCIVHFVGHKK